MVLIRKNITYIYDRKQLVSSLQTNPNNKIIVYSIKSISIAIICVIKNIVSVYFVDGQLNCKDKMFLVNANVTVDVSSS